MHGDLSGSLAMKHLKLIIGLLCVPLATCLAAIYVWPGYYILDGSKNGGSIAEDIIRRGKGVEACKRILDFDPFPSPSAEEQTSLCIYEYAKLTKDPSACELLLPGEYGFSCIGAAEDRHWKCSVEFGRRVEWGSYLDDTRQSATLEECKSGEVRRGLGEACCTISKVANIRGYDDCSSLAFDRTLFEQCLTELALKTGKQETCHPISGTGSRIACSLRARYKDSLSTLPSPIDVKSL